MKKYLISTVVALAWFLLFVFMGNSQQSWWYVAPSEMTAMMDDNSMKQVKAEYDATDRTYTAETFTTVVEEGRTWQFEEEPGRYISFSEDGYVYMLPSENLVPVTQQYIDQLESAERETLTANERLLLDQWGDGPKDKRLIWLMLLPLVVVGILAYIMRNISKKALSGEGGRNISSYAHLSVFVMVLELAMLVGGVYCFGNNAANPTDVLTFDNFSDLGFGLLFAVVFIALAVANIILCFVTNKLLLQASSLKFSWRSVLISLAIMMGVGVVAVVVAMQLGIQAKENWWIALIAVCGGLIYWVYDTAKHSPRMFRILPLLLLSTAIMVAFALAVSFVILILVIIIAVIYYAPMIHKLSKSAKNFTGRERGACCSSCARWDGSGCSIKSQTLDIDPSQGCGDFVARP